MKKLLFSLAAFALALSSCSEHFIADRSYRKMVEEDFMAKQTAIAEPTVFAIFEQDLTVPEREALMFLYAYMPLGDMLNMDGEYYLKNFHLTQEALSAMPWGSSIPEREMRHFILPPRVNNENLDHAREVFYHELKDRVKHLSMYDAVLEVNHWCHEKATYTPSDARTSSPLATVRTAYGRCGEESTLLVAALRAVGIPARQVYTPRWAHTDDNHAWVEAWVDGEWYFLGACEPEPVLNLGWFNAPASRGMLMHTKVFGKYDGPEDVMRQNALFTEINVIENYAPSPSKLTVTVLDSKGVPQEEAKVEFKLYNYAEFYTVATKYTDKNGNTSLTAGKGDMMVMAEKDELFGFRKVSFGTDSCVTITLAHKEHDNIGHMQVEIVPPAEKACIPSVTEEQRARNTQRMIQEDSIRTAYTATFFTKKKAEAFAARFQLDPEKTSALLIGARGNHQAIADFLTNAAQKGMAERAIGLLESISEKDLRDTPVEVLEDHLYNTDTESDIDKVLCPRVATELLTPYRKWLQDNIPADMAEQFRKNPANLVQWCRDSLHIVDEYSMNYVFVAPVNVFRTRVCDSQSREVFFVAMARSLGIPAWIDEITGNIKYIGPEGQMIAADFSSDKQTIQATGTLRLSYTPIQMLDNPKYYTHFTISKYEDGTFRLLNYPYGETDWATTFSNGAELDCGYYMLVSGSRMAQGNVLCDVEFFNIGRDSTTVADLVVRESNEQCRVIGSFDSEARYTTIDGKTTSVLQTTGRGYFVVGLIDSGKEPTNHALTDLSANAEKIAKWERPVLLLFASESDYKRFDKNLLASLPSNVRFGIDTNDSIRKMMAENMEVENNGRLPMFVIADTFNRVVFFSQGYTIGLGDQLVKVLDNI